MRSGLSGQDLDGDRASDAGVEGAIHLAHTSATQEGDDFVRPQTGAG
jgi:hypothetical protein